MSDSDLKTLAEIWEESDRQPVKVFNDASNDKGKLVGIVDSNAIVMSVDNSTISFRGSESKEWREQPKRLWPIIIKFCDHYEMTYQLFDSDKSAHDYCKLRGCEFIRPASVKDFAEGFLIEEEG
jgi:hypothetical protein